MRNQQTTTLPIYFQAIQSLKAAKDDTLDLIFHRLSQAWPSSIIDQEQFEEGGEKLEQKLHTFSERLLAETHYSLNRHRRELLRTYLLLRLHIQDEPLDAVTLPLAIKAVLTSQFREYFEQQMNGAFLYLVCSMFMPMFIILMQSSSPEPLELVPSHPESICCPLSFAQINSLYIQEGMFLRIMLERPLRILNDFPTLQGYDLYSRINLHDLLEDSNCLVSSSLANQKIISLVETFNFSKIVHFSDLIKGRRALNNNALLNTIEKLDIRHIFSQVAPQQQERSEISTKSFCLTVPISRKTLGKMHHFFECLPPQLAPLTKYDVLSFGSGEDSNALFFRLATEEYWEHCPQSQFMEVYYLANDSVVEWISLPHEEYTRSDTIRFWSGNEIRAISSPRFQACRGVQRKGDFVVVGQGHEHSWRVSKGYGMSVLIKWSVLLKSKSQLTKFLDIIKEKQDNQLDTNWRLEIPHRRMFFSMLAQQHQVLDGVMRTKLVGFIMGKVAYEEDTLIRLCRSFQDRLTLKKTPIPSKYRICGICGREIMSIFGRTSINIVCLDCLFDEISGAGSLVKFEVAYICKPSAFTNFFRGILSPPSEPIQALDIQAQRHAFYEQNFCQCKFPGCLSSEQPKNIEIHPQSHISNIYPSLQIHIFAKRNYFCTIESAFKCFCLKKSESQAERFQMRALLCYLSRSFLNRQQKQQIRECVYRHYQQTNYVADGIRILAQTDSVP